MIVGVNLGPRQAAPGRAGLPAPAAGGAAAADAAAPFGEIVLAWLGDGTAVHDEVTPPGGRSRAAGNGESHDADLPGGGDSDRGPGAIPLPIASATAVDLVRQDLAAVGGAHAAADVASAAPPNVPVAAAAVATTEGRGVISPPSFTGSTAVAGIRAVAASWQDVVGDTEPETMRDLAPAAGAPGAGPTATGHIDVPAEPRSTWARAAVVVVEAALDLPVAGPRADAQPAPTAEPGGPITETRATPGRNPTPGASSAPAHTDGRDRPPIRDIAPSAPRHGGSPPASDGAARSVVGRAATAGTTAFAGPSHAEVAAPPMPVPATPAASVASPAGGRWRRELITAAAVQAAMLGSAGAAPSGEAAAAPSPGLVAPAVAPGRARDGLFSGEVGAPARRDVEGMAPPPTATTLLEPRGTAGAAVTIAGPSPAAGGASLDDVLPTPIIRTIRLQWQSGTGEARVQLRPDYLGELTVAVKVEQGAVTATLHAEAPEVRRWIEAHSASLRDALAEQGLRLDRLVVADERGRQDPPDAERRDRQAGEDGDPPSRRRRGRTADATSIFAVPTSDSHERTTV